MTSTQSAKAILELKKQRFSEVVNRVCKKRNLSVPRLNFKGCEGEDENQLAHYHPDLHMICVSEIQLAKLNLEDVEQVAAHEVSHIRVHGHGPNFISEEANSNLSNFRPPAGAVVVSSNNTKTFKSKPTREDKTRCNYHICRKKTKLIQCEYCKNWYCGEHMNPFEPSIKIRGSAKISGHPCLGYLKYSIEKEKETNEKYKVALANATRKKGKTTEYYFPDTYVAQPHKETKEKTYTNISQIPGDIPKHISSNEPEEIKPTHTPHKKSSNYGFVIFVLVIALILISIYVNNSPQVQHQTKLKSNLSCPPGYQDLNVGKCVEIRYCSDKTKFGDCSNTKPLYCDAGILIERSDLCGCPSFAPRDGFSCGRAVPKGAVEWIKSLPNKISLLIGNVGNEIQNTIDEGTPEVQKTITQVKEAVTPAPLDVSLLERNIHDLINVERNNHGLSSLGFDSKLSVVARKHSQDMIDRSFFAHINPSGQDPTERGSLLGYGCYKNYGSYYTTGIAENIFSTHFRASVIGCDDSYSEEGVAKCVVDGWMNSPGHRQNILTPTYDVEGIGVAVSSYDAVLVTEDFC